MVLEVLIGASSQNAMHRILFSLFRLFPGNNTYHRSSGEMVTLGRKIMYLHHIDLDQGAILPLVYPTVYTEC